MYRIKFQTWINLKKWTCTITCPITSKQSHFLFLLPSSHELILSFFSFSDKEFPLPQNFMTQYLPRCQTLSVFLSFSPQPRCPLRKLWSCNATDDSSRGHSPARLPHPVDHLLLQRPSHHLRFDSLQSEVLREQRAEGISQNDLSLMFLISFTHFITNSFFHSFSKIDGCSARSRLWSQDLKHACLDVLSISPAGSQLNWKDERF